MNETTSRKRPSLALLALTLAGVLLSVGALVAAMPRHAEAIAPCVVHTPSGDELTFLGALQAWRNASIPGSQQLTQSAPLNAAAQGYAQFLANTPGAGGHYADGAGGFPWATRAINCGYPSNQAAGGEGVANTGTSSQALTVMTGETGGGVWVPANVGAPVKCVGVGKATSGSKTSWVVLLFAAFGECPGATTGGPPPSATSSASSTATKTATPTNTPTPTTTPTPSPTAQSDGSTLTVYEGWNLVTLPAGPVSDVLHRAAGCYRAIYQQNGSEWLRYSPEAPAYANNLQTLNGGTFWIEGTAANCGVVPL